MGMATWKVLTSGHGQMIKYSQPLSLAHVRDNTEAWQVNYNQKRPYSMRGYLIPSKSVWQI